MFKISLSQMKTSETSSRVSYQTAVEALQNELKKCHQEAMKYFMQRSEAISQLNAISNGAKLKATSGKNTQYTTLYETTATYENAAYAIENALLTNNFEPADFTGVEMLNIPNHFKRAQRIPPQQISPKIQSKEEESESDEVIYCGS